MPRSRSGGGRSRGRCRSGRARASRSSTRTRRAGGAAPRARRGSRAGRARRRGSGGCRGRTRGGRPGCGRCRSSSARSQRRWSRFAEPNSSRPFMPAGSVTPCSSTSRVEQPGEALGRGVEAQHLLDRAGIERRVGEQPGALVGEAPRASRARCRAAWWWSRCPRSRRNRSRAPRWARATGRRPTRRRARSSCRRSGCARRSAIDVGEVAVEPRRAVEAPRA